jgi:hypothetical protein
MNLHQAPSKAQLISKALETLLIGLFLVATQPGIDFAWDHRLDSDLKIAPLDHFRDAVVSRSGKDKEAEKSLQEFLGKVQDIAVVQRCSTLARKGVIPYNAESPRVFKIRSPPFCSVSTFK